MSDLRGYELLEAVAVGSTGTVWKARHQDLRRTVAVKELSTAMRNTPAVLARFRSEAAQLAQLDDDHIVRIFDYFEDDSAAYLVQEWIDGKTLEGVLAEHGALTAEQSVGVIRGALLGLAVAHEHQLVHGDVSPSNILLDRSGTSKLIDFGIATPVGTTGLIGTPAYMSPESAAGAGLLPQSDVYSSAAVLYTLLSGKPPMPGPDVVALLRQHRDDPPPRLADHGPAFAALLQRAMAKEPQVRPDNARAFLLELEETAEDRWGAAWLTRASVAGLAGGGATTGAVAAGVGNDPATASLATSPVVSTALDDTGAQPAPQRQDRRRSRLKMKLAATGLILVAAGAVTAVLVAGGTGHAHSSGESSGSKSKAKTVSVVKPATYASVEATADIMTGYAVSGACSGHGQYESAYHFFAARVPAAPDHVVFRLESAPSTDALTAPPVLIQCPGFQFSLGQNHTDKLFSHGTIGQTLTLSAADLTNPPGLPSNIPKDRVYVEVDTVPAFSGRGLPLQTCARESLTMGASKGAAGPPFKCLAANATYKLNVPLQTTATTCETQATADVHPLDISCHSTGHLTIILHTYATENAPSPHTSSPAARKT